jgi:hypothetical protein|tara:strand:+ start:2711 stop:3019 length:309 start_codon:yes stop_codon:yes gene_type:complete
MKLIPVTNENIHTIIPKYIEDNDITINDIDTMIDAYMKMVKDKYLFLIDRDLLKDLLVEITYMYSPNDDANKDRVLYHLVGSDSDDDDDDDDSASRKVDNVD